MFELAGPDSINLGLGELDFEPAKAAIDALDDAVRGGHNGYGPTRGIPELREALAQRLTKYRPDVETENVLVTDMGQFMLNQRMIDDCYSGHDWGIHQTMIKPFIQNRFYDALSGWFYWPVLHATLFPS